MRGSIGFFSLVLLACVVVISISLRQALRLHLGLFILCFLIFGVLRSRLPIWLMLVLTLSSPLLMHIIGHPILVQTLPLCVLSAWGLTGSVKKESVSSGVLLLLFAAFFLALSVLTAFREMGYEFLSGFRWMEQINLYNMTHLDALKLIAYECGRVLSGVLSWVLLSSINGSSRRHILLGFTGLATVGSFLALVQQVTDIAFLNPTYWSELHRASGLFQDSNMQGMLSALGIILPVRIMSFDGRHAWLTTVVMLVNGAGLFATGSRTSLLWIVLFFVLYGAFTVFQSLRRNSWRELLMEHRYTWVVAGLVIIALAVWVVYTRPSLWLRLSLEIGAERKDPGLTFHFSRAAGLGSRQFYWVTAVKIAREHWWSGVGPGAYPIYMTDYLARSRDAHLPDTALNWYLQQWADFGLMGCALVLYLLAPMIKNVRFNVFNGALWLGWLVSIAFTPPQHTAMTILMWGLAALTLWPPGGLMRPMIPSRKWLGTWLIFACFFIVAFALYGRSETPLQRLTRNGVTSRLFGFYGKEYWPGIGSFQWTQAWFGFTVPAEGPRCLMLRAWLGRPPGALKPVTLEPYLDGEKMAFSLVINSDTLQNIIIPLTKQPSSHSLLQVRVNPPWKPHEYGSTDNRTLGIAIASYRWLPKCSAKEPTP